HDLSEGALRAPLLIAVSLAFVGFLMYWVDGRYPPYRTITDMSTKDALWIGFAQAFALIPGVSRSGSTMTMGRFLGLNRESAARFSFLLSFPIIFAAGMLEVRNFYEAGGFAGNTSYLIAGFLASLVSGWLAIHVLLAYLRNADFAVFAWYRILLAIAVVGFSLMTGR
ncbi:undecaprenyl-diphosphate phosphatase, partial [bacterium]|nr:undecaprenyl-diphosphate phosphatase [bacterium]